MLLIAVSKISEIFHEPKIRNNYLVYFLASLFSIFTGLLFAEEIVYVLFFGLDLDILIKFWTLSCIPLIIGTFFLKRSYDEIGRKTGVKAFYNAAMLYFIGAILSLALIGAILVFVADIFNIVAFFSIPEKISQSQ